MTDKQLSDKMMLIRSYKKDIANINSLFDRKESLLTRGFFIALNPLGESVHVSNAMSKKVFEYIRLLYIEELHNLEKEVNERNQFDKKICTR